MRDEFDFSHTVVFVNLFLLAAVFSQLSLSWFLSACCCKETSKAQKVKDSAKKICCRESPPWHPSHKLTVLYYSCAHYCHKCIIETYAFNIFVRKYLLTFCKMFFFFMHRVVIERRRRGNLSHDCMIVYRSLLPSLHSVMSLIILFSFIASQTQLFI